jgi:hypothetical protein
LRSLKTGAAAIVKDMTVSGAVGVPAGLISAETDSLLRNSQFADWQSIKENATNYGVVGFAVAGLTHGMGAVAEARSSSAKAAIESGSVPVERLHAGFAWQENPLVREAVEINGKNFHAGEGSKALSPVLQTLSDGGTVSDAVNIAFRNVRPGEPAYDALEPMSDVLTAIVRSASAPPEQRMPAIEALTRQATIHFDDRQLHTLIAASEPERYMPGQTIDTRFSPAHQQEYAQKLAFRTAGKLGLYYPDLIDEHFFRPVESAIKESGDTDAFMLIQQMRRLDVAGLLPENIGDFYPFRTNLASQLLEGRGADLNAFLMWKYPQAQNAILSDTRLYPSADLLPVQELLNNLARDNGLAATIDSTVKTPLADGSRERYVHVSPVHILSDVMAAALRKAEPEVRAQALDSLRTIGLSGRITAGTRESDALPWENTQLAFLTAGKMRAYDPDTVDRLFLDQAIARVRSQSADPIEQSFIRGHLGQLLRNGYIDDLVGSLPADLR